MSEPTTQTALLRRYAPPWLQRSVGGRFLDAVGAVLDLLDLRASEGVEQRFPNAVDSSSLPMIGRERRIRRGPGESAQTYADRLRIWWDSHRLRGGPYALLWQLHHFFLYWLPGRKDVVYHSGTRRWIDADGEITRDAITWEADGSDEWSQFWLFMYVPAEIALEGDLLVTTWNELITTIGGDPIGTSYTVTISALTDAEAEVFRCIPREWSAAHIKRIHVVLYYGSGELWDYHLPDGNQVGTWDEWADPTKTVDEDAPVILTIEE